MFFFSLTPVISASLSITPSALRPAAMMFVYNFRTPHVMRGAIFISMEDYSLTQRSQSLEYFKYC